MVFARLSIPEVYLFMRKFVKENSSVLLSVAAGVGVVSTAYLAARGGYQSALVLSHEDPHDDIRTKAVRVWRLYVPAAASGTATIICLVGAKRSDARKTLAAQAALAVAQRAYEGYRAEVIEEFGGKRDQAILAKVAEKKVADNPPSTVVIGEGTVLCCELFNGRYFMSDMESLNKAVNELNAQLLRQDYATMDDFYYILDLEYTKSSGHSGWKTPKLLELEFSSILHKGRPVLAFDYNYVTSL